jgi:hypothetical protein
LIDGEIGCILEEDKADAGVGIVEGCPGSERLFANRMGEECEAPGLCENVDWVECDNAEGLHKPKIQLNISLADSPEAVPCIAGFDKVSPVSSGDLTSFYRICRMIWR